MAAASALVKALDSDACEKCRATRLADLGLLVESLHEMGAQVVYHSDHEVLALSQFGPLTFQLVAGVILGRVDGDEHATDEMVAALNTSAGRVAQARTALLLEQRATELGYQLVSSEDADGCLTYVFEEVTV